MSALTEVRDRTAVRARRSPVVPLAGVEGLRLVRHPLVLLACVLFAAMIYVSSSDGPGAGYGGVVTGPTFFLGVPAYFVANLAASRPRRHGCDEHHASLPATTAQRTAAVCLAGLAPAVLAVLLQLAALGWIGVSSARLAQLPSLAELAAGPLTVLGGSLLGVMVARWLPFPAAPVLVMLPIVVVTAALAEPPQTYQLLAPFAEFTVYREDGGWAGLHPGSITWHAVYLLALCVMAAAGALLRDAAAKLPLLLAGGAATGLAVVAGWAQLP